MLNNISTTYKGHHWNKCSNRIEPANFSPETESEENFRQASAIAIAASEDERPPPKRQQERPEKRRKHQGGGEIEGDEEVREAIGEVRGAAGVPARQRVHPRLLPLRVAGEGCVVERLRVAQRNPKRLDVSDSHFTSLSFRRFLQTIGVRLSQRVLCIVVWCRHLGGFLIFAAMAVLSTTATAKLGIGDLLRY